MIKKALAGIVFELRFASVMKMLAPKARLRDSIYFDCAIWLKIRRFRTIAVALRGTKKGWFSPAL
jgi:hypothetical protein